MNRGENSDSISIDLISDILSRLPAKSITRFLCVSKLWGSLLCEPYFTELFLTRSLAHPRLLIGVKQDGEWFLFSAPQPQNPSSLVVAADFHMKMSFDLIYYILTLGTEELRWRTTECPSHPYSGFRGNGICIDGVLYYLCYDEDCGYTFLSCFDIRSEKVEFVDPGTCGMNEITTLINYKGKLGLINMENDCHDGGFPLKLHMWVLEDIEKREFSAYVYTLRTDEDKVVKDDQYISVVGATASGEIVLVKDNASAPFDVFYFNPESNILRSVEIQGITRQDGVEWSDDYHEVYVFVDHVEDLNFDVTKTPYAAT
ncbi:PREDICTED: F-box protein At1g31080-like [Camelina sativa]|uniref:F-box protein At1g31080-like n=1 Tax=Camelina sativa TaxID=90675 RepID=A0ABM1QWF7_CAMSA|nr:PREDICTED: F-box protein At1g31080-like [Camelina sativa]